MKLLDTHWGHLATKPAQSLLIFGVLSWLHVPVVLAAGVSLIVPAIYSGIRKEILWPGSMTSVIGWKDLVADTWAASVVILPLVSGMPVGYKVWLGVTMCAVLWPLGLHKWALP
jgi:hypothetical protein